MIASPSFQSLGGKKEKPSQSFYFGASAFRAWAEDIEQGCFDLVKPEDFDPWSAHTAYVCGLATNASCCNDFLDKAMELNPDLAFLEEVGALCNRCGEIWNHDNGTDLEALGGGFNVNLEALRDKRRWSRIADKLREFAEVTEEIERVLWRGVRSV